MVSGRLAAAICQAAMSSVLAWSSWGAAEAVVGATDLAPLLVTPSSFSLIDAAEAGAGVRALDARDLPLIDNDVIRTVHPLPGVVATDFSARFQLRGSEKDEVLVRLDGMELFDPFHLQDFGGALSVIDSSLVGDARLFMGGFPAAYGDAMGGVLELGTVRPGRDAETAVGLDLLKMQLRSQGPLGGGDYLFSARRGYIDLILGLVDAIEPLEEKFRPRYTDVFGQVRQPAWGGRDATVSAVYARDTNEVDKTGHLDDVESAYDNLLTWGRVSAGVPGGGSLDIRPYFGRATRDRVEGEADVDLREITYGGSRFDALVPLSEAHLAGIGTDVRWATGSYRYFETTSPFPELEDPSTPFDIDTELSGVDIRSYAQDEWRVSEHAAAIVGVRTLWQSYRREVVASPRLAVAVRPVGDATLRVAWGRFIRTIDPLSLPVEGNVDGQREPEVTTHAVAGVEWRPSADQLVRGEVYTKRGKDLVGRSRDVGRKSDFITLPDASRAYGAELFAERRVSEDFAWSAGYAYAVAEGEVDGVTLRRDFDQRHTVVLASAYKLSDRLRLNGQWRFHTGTPVTFARDSSGRVVGVQLGETNSERVPAFHSLDVRLTRTYEFRRWELTAYFQVINLYARSNVQEYSYDREQDYLRVEEGFLPITPTFGLAGTF